MPNGSLQGEHIFNALGDLAEEMALFLIRAINAAAPFEKRVVATEAIRPLRNYAAALIRERNQADFRTGPRGDITNASRYSQFSQATRSAIRNIVSGNPSSHTRGYTDLNRLLDGLDRYTIDQTAHDSARQALTVQRQGQFDRWFNSTRASMHSTFKMLIDAALEVNRTHIS